MTTPRPAPKPVREKKKKRKTSHKWCVCVNCGETWKDEERHAPECPREIIKTFHKYHSREWMLEEALDEICRLITTWRDGVPCVINTSECGGVSQWGHVVAQGSSSWLKHELGNSARQCKNHNGIHRHVELPYHNWYIEKFGKKALRALDAERQRVPTYKWTAVEMRERLIEYNELYDMRFSMAGATLPELVEKGYYGQIVKRVWTEEGRI